MQKYLVIELWGIFFLFTGNLEKLYTSLTFLLIVFQGNVYVKCPSIAAAIAAVNALHGRWFAGEFHLFFCVTIMKDVI